MSFPVFYLQGLYSSCISAVSCLCMNPVFLVLESRRLAWTQFSKQCIPKYYKKLQYILDECSGKSLHYYTSSNDDLLSESLCKPS